MKKWFANKRMRSGNTRKAKRTDKGKRPFEALERIAKRLRQSEQKTHNKKVEVCDMEDLALRVNSDTAAI